MLQTTTTIIAQVLNTNCVANVKFKGVYTDSRKRMDGGLFVALIGENFDAHNYVKQAQNMGAVAVIASQAINTNLPTLLVNNTQTALGDLARWHLDNISPIVVAITGSNGKTTTKNMLKNILQLTAPTLATQGNLNNHLGVPITLLQLTNQQYAVIEMGANHLGEIAYLRNIAKPDVAVVINTLDAHIGEFGGFDNLVKAKGEIYTKNSKNIVNTHTSFSGDIRFGEGGDIVANNSHNNHFELVIFDEKININLQLLGKHNIDNALAAASCAYALGIDIQTIKRGLENTTAAKGRLNIIKKSGLTIIDDSYNANPSSAKYALQVLASFKGQRIAILGQMAQLGQQSARLHAQIGQYAKTLRIDALYSIGENAQQYGIEHFNSEAQLLARLKTQTNATVLFKGSRIAKLEQIIAKL